MRREHTAQGRKRCRLVIMRTVAFVRRARRASLRASLRVTAASTLPSTHRVVRPSSRPRHGAERACISAERASPDKRARPHSMESRLASPVVGRRDGLEPDGCAGWEQVHRVDAVPPLPGQQVHRPAARAGEEAQTAVLDDVRSAGRGVAVSSDPNSASGSLLYTVTAGRDASDPARPRPTPGPCTSRCAGRENGYRPAWERPTAGL